jgi:hypothetical protein
MHRSDLVQRIRYSIGGKTYRGAGPISAQVAGRGDTAVTLKYSATMGSHQIWSKSASGTLTSGTAGDYRMTVPFHLGSHAGSVKVAASVTINGATGQATTPFRIKK